MDFSLVSLNSVNPAMMAAMLQQMPPELLQQMAAGIAQQGGGGMDQAQIMAMLQNPQMYRRVEMFPPRNYLWCNICVSCVG